MQLPFLNLQTRVAIKNELEKINKRSVTRIFEARSAILSNFFTYKIECIDKASSSSFFYKVRLFDGKKIEFDDLYVKL
jgi:hypothetical protein